MKSKIKKFIKRCTIFLTVFVICFSCFSFSSAALGDNSNGLFLDYVRKPVIQHQVNGSWVDLAEFDSYTFYQASDGSIDKMIYSWTGLYGNLNSGTRYRVLYRFYLRGPNAEQNSISFNSYFSSALNLENSNDPSSFISIGTIEASSYYYSGDSYKTTNAIVTSLGSRPGVNLVFSSFYELNGDNKIVGNVNPRNTVYMYFTPSDDLKEITLSIDNFSADLFFQAPSDEAFQDYDNAEQQILDSTAQGRDEATSLFGGFGSLATYVSTPILAVGNIMGEFFSEIDILNTVLRFSLSLGIFSFLVGMAVSIGGYFSSKVHAQESRDLKFNKQLDKFYRSKK